VEDRFLTHAHADPQQRRWLSAPTCPADSDLAALRPFSHSHGSVRPNFARMPEGRRESHPSKLRRASGACPPQCILPRQPPFPPPPTCHSDRSPAKQDEAEESRLSPPGQAPSLRATAPHARARTSRRCCHSERSEESRRSLLVWFRRFRPLVLRSEARPSGPARPGLLRRVASGPKPPKPPTTETQQSPSCFGSCTAEAGLADYAPPPANPCASSHGSCPCLNGT